MPIPRPVIFLIFSVVSALQAANPPKSTVMAPGIRAEIDATQWPEGSWAIITDGSETSAKHLAPKQITAHAGVWDTLKHLLPVAGLIGAGFVLTAFLVSGKRKNRQTHA